jgi:hypothetical protein
VLADSNVFKPLKLKNSTFNQPLDRAKWRNVAVAHDDKGNPITGLARTYPELAAAGLWTTPTDLVNIGNDIMLSYLHDEGKILSQKSAREMLHKQHEHQSKQHEHQSMGIGFILETNESDELSGFFHDGANYGFKSFFACIPKNKQCVAAMTNSDNGFLLVREIIQRVSEIYKWGIFKPQIKKIAELSKARLACFVGTYAIKDITFTVKLSADELHLEMIESVSKDPIEMFPESTSKFFNMMGDEFEFNFAESKPNATLLIINNHFKAARIASD